MKFEFSSNKLALYIAGLEFLVYPFDENFQKKMTEFSIKATEMSKTIDEGNDGQVQATKFMADTLDDILGAQAVSEIFKAAGREINFYDLLDVFMYISMEVQEFKTHKLRQYEKPPIKQQQFNKPYFKKKKR